MPGVACQPEKLDTDENALLKLLDRWRMEAEKAGHNITRITVAFEAGRDGFWLARWLTGVTSSPCYSCIERCGVAGAPARQDRRLDTGSRNVPFLAGCAASVITARRSRSPPSRMKMPNGPTASATASLVSKSHRQPHESGLGAARHPQLQSQAEEGRRAPRGFAHARGRAIPPNTLAELRRDMERRRLVMDQIRKIEDARLERLKQAPNEGPHAMVRLLARVIGISIETADMLVQEVLSRNLRDRRAVARYAGLTGSPDESGSKRREKGLARAGNARVRRGMIQLAWRFLLFQKESALARWYRAARRTPAVRAKP